MGTHEFLTLLSGLSPEARFVLALDGKGPDPSVDESIAILDGI